MKRNISIFIATFVVGAVIAFAGRAVLHEPQVAAGEHAAPTRAPMVSNPLMPATRESTSQEHAGHAEPEAPKPAAAKPAHDGHAMSTAASTDAPVNTVCAICGMEVSPKVPTIEYQGKTIGFACKMCPPKFKADPDKYGPIYLRNEVIKR